MRAVPSSGRELTVRGCTQYESERDRRQDSLQGTHRQLSSGSSADPSYSRQIRGPVLAAVVPACKHDSEGSSDAMAGERRHWFAAQGPIPRGGRFPAGIARSGHAATRPGGRSSGNAATRGCFRSSTRAQREGVTSVLRVVC